MAGKIIQLIRDNLPDIAMQEDGIKLKTAVITDPEFLVELCIDLLTEHTAILRNNWPNIDLDTIADTVTLLKTLVGLTEYSWKDLQNKIKERETTLGKFDKHLIGIFDTEE